MNLKEFLEHSCKIKNYILLVDEKIFRIYILIRNTVKDEKVKVDLIKNYLLQNNKFYDVFFVTSKTDIFIRERIYTKGVK